VGLADLGHLDVGRQAILVGTIADPGRDDGHFYPQLAQRQGGVANVRLHAAGAVEVVRADLRDPERRDVNAPCSGEVDDLAVL
jgi:hypothetical protein